MSLGRRQYEWRHRIYQFLWEHKHLFQEPILDIGAGNVEVFKNWFGGQTADLRETYNVDVHLVDGRIPYENESIGTILMIEVLEHALEPRELLQECVRVLKPTGYIFGSVPFSCIGFHDNDYWRFTIDGLIHLFSIESLTGFTAVQFVSNYTIYSPEDVNSGNPDGILFYAQKKEYGSEEKEHSLDRPDGNQGQ